MNHTPGPWTIERYNDGVVYGLSSDEPGRDVEMVCEMPYRNKNDEANARLIVVAPEMLEIIREMAAFKAWNETEGNYVCWVGESLIEKAEEILKKVTSKSAEKSES